MGEKLTKIAEFARVNEISDRHARRLLKSYEADIEGHFEKRGGAGTWLDEYAVEYLRSKLRVQVDPVEVLPARLDFADNGAALAEAQERFNKLLTEYHKVVDRLADAERRATENAIAAAQVKLLEAAKDDLNAQIADLRADNASKDKKVEEATKDAQNARNEAQGALGALTEAIKEKNKAEQDIEKYKTEADAEHRRAETAEARIRELENRKWWQLLFKKKKQEE